MSFKKTWGVRLFGLTKIPMIAFLSPSVIKMDQEETIIKIPLNWRTKNHLGSMYFAALAAGADLAGGMLAMNIIKKSNKKIHLSFKDFKANFLKRAQGHTCFYNHQGPEISRFVQKVSENPGVRMNMPLQMFAKCPDLSDEKVAEFTLTLSLKCKA